MSNESNNTSQDQVEEAVTPEVVADEVSLMDE
ncbi:MAG: molecular chaperone GrpE, partial [Shewanella sp.]